MQHYFRAYSLVLALLLLFSCNSGPSFSTSHTDSAGPGNGQAGEKAGGSKDPRPTEGDEPVPGYLLTSPQMTASANAQTGQVTLSGPKGSYTAQTSGAVLTVWRVPNTSLAASVAGDGTDMEIAATYLATIPVRPDGSFSYVVEFGSSGAFIAIATDAKPYDTHIVVANSSATTVAFKNPYASGPMLGVTYQPPYPSTSSGVAYGYGTVSDYGTETVAATSTTEGSTLGTTVGAGSASASGTIQ